MKFMLENVKSSNYMTTSSSSLRDVSERIKLGLRFVSMQSIDRLTTVQYSHTRACFSCLMCASSLPFASIRVILLCKQRLEAFCLLVNSFLYHFIWLLKMTYYFST